MAQILVLDDERHVVRLIQVNLERAGYEVASFSDPRLALEHVQEATPDLAIVDWMMPYMDGGEVMDALRAHPATASIPVLVLITKTAEADPWLRAIEEVRTHGVPFLNKPFNPQEMIGMVRRLLAARGET